MKNTVVKMPDQNRVFDEASDWMVKFDRGLKPAEELEFQNWVHEAPEHYRTFMSMAKLWDGMDDLSRLSDLFPEPAIESKIQSTTTFSKPWAVAASFLIVAVSAVMFFTYQNHLTQLQEVANKYETSVGEQSTVTLSDGSTLVLNTNSYVTVDFDGANRLITLKRGEMHIDVAHDKTRPLSVKAGSKVVQAVGTAFNIELLDSKKLELIVLDGEVRVGDREQFEVEMLDINPSKKAAPADVKPLRLSVASLSVSKGEKALLGFKAPSKLKLDDKALENDLLWQSGNVVFKGESLENALAEISRYTSVQFTIVSPEIKSVRLAGLFKTGDINGLLIALDESFNITSERVSEGRVNLYAGTKSL